MLNHYSSFILYIHLLNGYKEYAIFTCEHLIFYKKLEKRTIPYSTHTIARPFAN